MNWKYLKYDLEDKWQRVVEVRKWLNENPGVAKIMAAVSACILLIVILYFIWPASEQKYASADKAWYYDLNTGKLFVSSAFQNPPIEAPSGPLANGEPAGVLAYVYQIGFDKNAERVIAFLEKLTPEAKHTRPTKLSPPDKRTQQEIELWNKGRLVKTVDANDWIPYVSPQGQALIDETTQKIRLCSVENLNRHA
jgi:hypothetical protein